MATDLERIAEVARKNPKAKLDTLVHHINEGTLWMAHLEQNRHKASGVDEVTKDEYEKRLDQNLSDLVARMKRQAYKPQPSRRVYIEKPGTNKLRPLGIPAYEDKLVQSVMADILNAIFENDFLDCSFGFRPNRSCHMALKTLGEIIERKKIGFVVDVDIRGFFDNVNHEWLMKFLRHRIADPNFLRLTARFLKAGIMEEGVKYDTPGGTPQGGLCSPILANLYLHHVLDLWFEYTIKARYQGDAYMVRYADDFVCCFQHEGEARNFLVVLKERLAKFGLEIAEDKTKIVRFGRFANEGDRKSGTFNFLGFTHYCSQSQAGRFRVKRKTMSKRYRAKLREFKEWIRTNRHLKATKLMGELNLKLRGYYQYYGITDNALINWAFRQDIEKLLFKWLNRRSGRKSFDWNKFQRFLKKWPVRKPRVYVNVYDWDDRLTAIYAGVVRSRVR